MVLATSAVARRSNSSGNAKLKYSVGDNAFLGFGCVDNSSGSVSTSYSVLIFVFIFPSLGNTYRVMALADSEREPGIFPSIFLHHLVREKTFSSYV